MSKIFRLKELYQIFTAKPKDNVICNVKSEVVLCR